MKKKIEIEYERTLVMLNIDNEILMVADRIKIDMAPYRAILDEMYMNNNIKGIKIFQKDILSGWQECEQPNLKRKVFEEYKKRLGTNVEDDLESNKDILKKVLKRKIILDLEEYRALHEFVSDNFEDIKKNMNKINKLIEEFEKKHNILE